MFEMLSYARSLLNIPYIYGGKNPLVGLDCSGLVGCVLATVSMDPPGDQNAQAYHSHFAKEGIGNLIAPGGLVFYSSHKDINKIDHIALFLNQKQVIEAGGGDSTTVSLENAKHKPAAFVRIRPFDHRDDYMEIIMPNYPSWVLNAI